MKSGIYNVLPIASVEWLFERTRCFKPKPARTRQWGWSVTIIKLTTLYRTDIIFMVKITVILQIQLRRLKGSVSKTNPFKGLRPSALIFHERNKNCFLFTLIINYRIQFKWKIWGTKWGLLLQKSTLCLIMIWSLTQ